MKSALDTALDAVIDQIIAPGGQLSVGDVKVREATLPAFANGPSNMRDYLAYFFGTNADKEFLVYRDERLTFAEVYAQAIKVAACLQHSHGIAKGDRVAIAMRNYPEWVTSFVAVLHLGAIAVPMNAWWQPDELAYGLADSGTRLVIADEERARRMADLAGGNRKLLTVRTSREVADELGFERLEDSLAAAPATPWFLPEIGPEDDATIMYTSGSTGSPKGAVSTHRALASGAMNYLVAGWRCSNSATRRGSRPRRNRSCCSTCRCSTSPGRCRCCSSRSPSGGRW